MLNLVNWFLRLKRRKVQNSEQGLNLKLNLKARRRAIQNDAIILAEGLIHSIRSLGFGLFLLILTTLRLQAQNTNVQINPQCVLSFQLSANGNSSSFDNRYWGCDNWAVSWETFGASPASSLTFQQAPSNAAGASAGTFTTFSGTPLTGANPSTATLGSVTIQGYSPWVRVNVAGLSGTARGMILGCRLPCSLSSGSGGGGSSSVTVTNFPNIGYGLPACTSAPSRATISIAGTGSTEIIAASGSTSIKICKIQLAGNAATTLQFSQGTGTNCGTGTSNIFGGSGLPNVTNVAFDYDGGMILSASQAFCVSSSVASAISGVVTYVQN